MEAELTASITHSEIPMFWTRLMFAVAIGKGAIAGAGLALALLGALDVAMAVTAQQWLKSIQANYLEEITLGGSIIGAVARAFFFK